MTGEITVAIHQRPIQTLARAYGDIRAGGLPWNALNEFFHEWFDYSRDQRATLVADAIVYEQPTRENELTQSPENADLWRWAVFCCAAAEYLCVRYNVPCPEWVKNPAYTLSEPWYSFGHPADCSVEYCAYLERTTPPELRRRNILGGDRVFANKYEFADQVRRLYGKREMQK